MVFYSNTDAENRHIIPYTKNIINNDIDAYTKFRHLRHIYNKKWVTESQGNKCGFMNDIPESFPVFIKPYINLRGGNLDCYVIQNIDEFKEYSHRNDMFWTPLYDGNESSTDFLVHNGNILFQLSYEIEKLEDRILGMMTKISLDNMCPQQIQNWIQIHLSDYSGPVNIQYIGNNIIEVGLRFDSRGNFIQWTNNKTIIERINKFIDTGIWKSMSKQELFFTPRYICGCYKNYPVIYYLPAPIVKCIVYYLNIENYNFYVDVDKNGLKYLNIVDPDREKLKLAKTIVEICMNCMNIFILFLFSLLVMNFIYTQKINKQLLIITTLIFMTRFINPPKYIRRIV